MNTKFLILQIVQFATNNLEQAHNEVIKLLAGGSMISNGEIDSILRELRNIHHISEEIKKRLNYVREIDAKRMELIETAKKFDAVVN